MNIRHDILCRCGRIFTDVFFKPSRIIDGVVTFLDEDRLECFECGSNKFTIYWGNGEAPIARAKTEFIGDIWDKANIDHNSLQHKKRMTDAIIKGKNKNV